MSFTADEKSLVTLSGTGAIDVWDWHRGSRLIPTRRIPGNLSAAAINAVGNTIITGEADGRVRRWKIEPR